MQSTWHGRAWKCTSQDPNTQGCSIHPQILAPCCWYGVEVIGREKGISDKDMYGVLDRPRTGQSRRNRSSPPASRYGDVHLALPRPVCVPRRRWQLAHMRVVVLELGRRLSSVRARVPAEEVAAALEAVQAARAGAVATGGLLEQVGGGGARPAGARVVVGGSGRRSRRRDWNGVDGSRGRHCCCFCVCVWCRTVG